MAGDAKKLQPIIVKRIKKGGHGAHGGAWKIAYADFVTAMMAFFLLMWLLGSTTEGDRSPSGGRRRTRRLGGQGQFFFTWPSSSLKVGRSVEYSTLRPNSMAVCGA